MGGIAGDLIAYAEEVMEDTTTNGKDPNEENVPGDKHCGDEPRGLSL